MCSYVHTVQRTRIATLYGSGPARGLATPLSGHKAQTLSGITSATHTWEAAPVLVRYGRWTRLINVSLMAFNSSAVRDGSSPHPEAVWVPCLSDRRTLSPDVMIFRATTDSTERHMHGPLLHVPITKYKIIPNPNPNPNTNMTVNTIPKQM